MSILFKNAIAIGAIVAALGGTLGMTFPALAHGGGGGGGGWGGHAGGGGGGWGGHAGGGGWGRHGGHYGRYYGYRRGHGWGRWWGYPYCPYPYGSPAWSYYCYPYYGY